MSSQFKKEKIDKSLFFSQDRPSHIQFSLAKEDGDELIHNDWAYSTGFFLFPVTMTIEEFIISDDDEMRNRMDLLTQDNRVRPENKHLMMDIEKICDPGKFRTYAADPDFPVEQFFNKLKVRIDYFRELFPNNTLGIYGYPIPNGVNNYSTLKPQVDFIKKGMSMGVYDSIDVMWAVLYQRFGPTDSNYNKNRLNSATIGALNRADEFRRSDGTRFKIGALLSQQVFNSPSLTNHNLEVHSEKVKQQREIITAQFPDVLQAVWAADGAKAGRQWWREIYIGKDMKF